MEIDARIVGVSYLGKARIRMSTGEKISGLIGAIVYATFVFFMLPSPSLLLQRLLLSLGMGGLILIAVYCTKLLNR